MKNALRSPLAALGLSLTMLSPALLPSARADGAAPLARCTLKVVNALPGPGGIDPAITRLRTYLEKPPFSHWKSFKLLSEKDDELHPGGSAHYKLPNGKDAVVSYTEHLSVAKKHIVRGTLQVESAKGATAKTAFSLDEGGFFMFAGEDFNGGMLIYSLSCKTED